MDRFICMAKKKRFEFFPALNMYFFAGEPKVISRNLILLESRRFNIPSFVIRGCGRPEKILRCIGLIHILTSIFSGSHDHHRARSEHRICESKPFQTTVRNDSSPLKPLNRTSSHEKLPRTCVTWFYAVCGSLSL